ncbi:MAG: 6-phosphofructokinase [Deltaproteobacteria bacterium]|nr:6-phosphofructokinase [Deltaproteobacteria bacterium]
MSQEKKSVAILVGGGPAPGINGVISAAAIEAINRGHTVYGVQRGFHYLVKGDSSCLRELTIDDVSSIDRDGGSILGTSRENPRSSADGVSQVVEALRSFGVGYLVTIGGDDTVSSAAAIAEAAKNEIAVAHVPKTIDNDLPLPDKASTFGFQSAREAGTEIVETLMVDAKTTGRWYLVVAMGRKAGHLALGIGVSAGATLTLIPEEFGYKKIPIGLIADIIVGSALKRLVAGRPHGVAVLAEGLAELIDPASVPEFANVERDPHGNIRFAEIDLGGVLRKCIKSRFKQLGLDLVAVDKNVGYELRCVRPIPFDREYTRQLGYGVIDFLLNGGSGAMITRRSNELAPLPFGDIIDSTTGKSSIRLVDLESIYYKVATKYMIRLTREDLKNSILVRKMASLTTVDTAELCKMFEAATASFVTYPAQFDIHK